jgi:hypothetical protein
MEGTHQQIRIKDPFELPQFGGLYNGFEVFIRQVLEPESIPRFEETVESVRDADWITVSNRASVEVDFASTRICALRKNRQIHISTLC